MTKKAKEEGEYQKQTKKKVYLKIKRIGNKEFYRINQRTDNLESCSLVENDNSFIID